MRLFLGLCVAALCAPLGAAATAPQWIWLNEEKDGQQAFFRFEFTLEAAATEAIFAGACDNELTVFVNGDRVMKHGDWGFVAVAPVRANLQPGRNVIAIEARNQEGAAGLFGRLTVTARDGKQSVFVTDGAWKASPQAAEGWTAPDFDASGWAAARVLGPVGDASVPWSDKVTLATVAQAEATDLDPTPVAEAVADLNLLPGFKAERLYTVPKGVQGSWVAVANAPDGGLYVSDQDDAGLFHVKPAALGQADAKTVVTPLSAAISSAQGLLWAHGGLYVHVNSGGKSGLYKLTDTDGDGDLETVTKLSDIPGGGEHGPHAIIPAEDGDNLYIAAGNHTDLPALSGSRVPTNWSEDHLLPRQWDARGHAKGRMAPGGWVAKVTPDGKQWELYSIGYRNEYDIALNTEGEMFTFDADMEWDMGTPWYRPTRVNHVVSGSEFGWRSGTGKWPAYYEDSLPAVVDIGPGSPTGVVFGTGAKFPAKYQHALYILDWTFGTIYAVHLKPEGASYTGVKEEFISGSPLAVTDAVIGADGAFYFAVGGRGTQSALYRVYYAGDEATAPAVRKDPPAAVEARKIRRSLEAFHGHADPAAADALWPYLGSSDRFLRYTARVALEWQPVDQWKDRALKENNPQAAASAFIALARQGDAALQPALLDSMARFNLTAMPESAALGMLRAYGLSFLRQGRPDQPAIGRVISQLDFMLPSKSDNLNAELLQVLVYLDAPGIIDKGLALMAEARPEAIPNWAELLKRNQGYGGTILAMLDNHPPARKINYAFMLRNVRYGWTMPQREQYFQFIIDAAKYPGGASYSGFLANIRDEALENCSEAEKVALAPITGQSLEALPAFEIKELKGTDTPWTLETALAAVRAKGLRQRNFENGRNAYYASGCAQCHRFDGAGGAVGPDLSSVANKFSVEDILEAIIEPSKVISDQYSSSIIRLNNFTEYEGIVINHSGAEEEGRMTIYPKALNADPIEVKTADVESIEPSRLSQMPQGLLDFMSEDEMLDLLGYLQSKGNPEASVFE
ncbi:MAG: c-type cytochrome [Candidatus Hydrogenedentes bacterium]|nr:c-type cytochrome [Candidatus Hydrogenedentota bacterium]